MAEVKDVGPFGQVNINLNTNPAPEIKPAPQAGSTFGGFTFGKNVDQTQSNAGAKPGMNYGNFGADKKRTASLPINNFVSKGSGSFTNFTMNQNAPEEFKAVEQFRLSLAEVTTNKLNNRIFNQSAAAATPNLDYLKSKRGSVFHKAFESGQAIKDFVPPTYPKPEAS